MGKKKRPTEEQAIRDGFTDEPLDCFSIVGSAIVVCECTGDWLQSHQRTMGKWGSDEAVHALENIAIMLQAVIKEYASGLAEMEIIPPEGMVWKKVDPKELLERDGGDLPF